jgi:hypothetical protein
MGSKMVLDETELMYVSVQGVSNARGAFDKLESKLPGLKGRKFYGYFNPDTDEYRACVARKAEDSRPETIGLRQWTIPKGLYTYERIEDWNSKKDLIAATFERMIRENDDVIDWARPILEFYKSMNGLRLLVPVTR